MDFAHDDRTTELIGVLTEFLETEVYPAEAELDAELAANPDRWSEPAVVGRLRASARRRGLWNLFLPGARGAGLSNLQYAPLAELTGRSIRLAPAALNCAAPDTGNMELLAEFGTAAQQSEWLEPLLDARIRSSFCMTEPDVASSDASNIETRHRARRWRLPDHRAASGGRRAP